MCSSSSACVLCLPMLYCRHQRKKEEKGYFLYFLILIRTAYLEILKTELLRIRSWNQNEICFEHVKYQTYKGNFYRCQVLRLADSVFGSLRSIYWKLN
ncbi:uncharacterized protein LOC115610462 isoform X10 [Strigops habroptila]|uniref:uncharacterized protein LOC115610462 isoform X10 n=1 Tax=Strigops habroptila TaxID=2489341 RepID=UPI0011CFFCC1|nr:uncharacterized protein LOC115610462 isoform X10 [Strigops habroptila]